MCPFSTVQARHLSSAFRLGGRVVDGLIEVIESRESSLVETFPL
jgi:hypothetical protein